MEEKKAKEVRMSPAKGEKHERQKLTYEQLNDACQQLFQQNQHLFKQVRELNAASMFKRLDYLFKVVELAPAFKDDEFIGRCVGEIKEAMALPKGNGDKEEEG